MKHLGRMTKNEEASLVNSIIEIRDGIVYRHRNHPEQLEAALLDMHNFLNSMVGSLEDYEEDCTAAVIN